MDAALFTSLKENTSHGNVLLPYNYYNCSVPSTYRNLPTHWHPEMELTMIISGRITYYIDMTPLQLNAGDLLIISPNTLHSAHQINRYTMTSDSLLFHLDMIGYQQTDTCSIKYLTPIMNGNIKFPHVIRPSDAGYTEIKECFQTLVEAHQKKPYGYELLIKEKLLSFIFLLFQFNHYTCSSKEIIIPTSEYKIKQVLSYIQKHYSEAITISELSKLCNFSEIHFMNFFKKTVGTTCIKYINNYRLAMAAVALETTNDSIMNIALECGFHNISYFNRQFKQQFNMTPKDYRRNIHKS